MGELIQVKRNLSESYSAINVFKNVGNPGFCGWGVRDRDDVTIAGKTYFCTVYPGPPMSTIKKVSFKTDTATSAAYLTGDTGAEGTFGTWAAVTDGSFRITIDGTAYNVDAINFTGDLSMADVAATIQAEIRTATGALETVVWSTNHFVITTVNSSSSAITVTETSTGTVGTDISGAGASDWMDADTANGVVTDGNDFTFSIWSYEGGSTFSLVGSEILTVPDAGWENDTKYLVELVSSIFLSGAVDKEYYIAIYSGTATLQATDDLPLVRGKIYTGNAAMAGVTIPVPDAMRTAVSVEAWGDPASWEKDLVGGAILDYNEDWWSTEVGDWTTMSNIEVLGGGSAISGAADAVMSIDLADGQVATSIWYGVSFPDYTTMGVRAIVEIRVVGNSPSSGKICILFNDTDSDSLPTSGWANLYEIIGTGSTFDVTIYTPFVARWIRFLETGGKTDDEIDFVQIKYVTTAVTDGEYMVNHAQAYHGVWVDTTPGADVLYRALSKNAWGQTSYISDQFTNRKNKD